MHKLLQIISRELNLVQQNMVMSGSSGTLKEESDYKEKE